MTNPPSEQFVQGGSIVTGPRVVVFTSTYNRRGLLHRPFASLLAQTYRNIVWFLVDDGSTDDTASLVQEWMAEGHDWIQYHPKAHEGLHFAWNYMLTHADGDFVIQLDSDDELLPDGIENLVAAWGSIPEGEREGFVGVCANCINQNGTLDGDLFPQSPLDGSFWERTAKYKVHGEKVGMNRLDVLKRYPFPEVQGTTTITENWMWFQVSDQYRCRYVNDIVRRYFVEMERDDQTSRSRSTNALGYYTYVSYVTRHFMHHFWEDPKFFLETFVKVNYYLYWTHQSFREELRNTNSLLAKVGLVLARPAGYIYFRRFGPKQRL